MEQRAERDHDFRIVALEPVVGDDRGLDAVLRELPQELECDVRDDLDVNPGVVVDLHPSDRVDVRDVPPGLQLLVLVDPFEQRPKLAVPARRNLEPHPLHGLGGRQPGVFLGLLGDRLLDPFLRFFVERHQATSEAQSP